MKYFLKSAATLSFWRYSLFSGEGIAKTFAVLGAQYAIMDMADFFSIYSKDKHSRYAILVMLVISVVWTVASRRPIKRFSCKIPGRDFRIGVKIGDLFEGENDVVVSTNTTFDTDMASGLIDTDSIQGQVATRFFNANTLEIDRQLEHDLSKATGNYRADALGKKTEYPIGTVARVKSHNRTFYFVAMSRLNSSGTAGSTPRDIEDALAATWSFIRSDGSVRDLSIPLIGTGRGRIGIQRRKMVERIAQSFIDGSSEQTFCNYLNIFIRPEDADKFGVNMYEIRDYLVQGMHS